MADLKLLRTPKIVFNEGRESVAFPMPTPGFLFRTATKESEPGALSNLMAFPATISMNNNLLFHLKSAYNTQFSALVAIHH
jgi:hypothetical protein